MHKEFTVFECCLYLLYYISVNLLCFKIYPTGWMIMLPPTILTV